MSGDQCIRSLQVDIDLPYSFVNLNFNIYLKVARDVLAMFGYRDLVVKLRRSRSGYAHVIIVLDKCVDLKHYHVLMWLLGDHHDRIRHSMRRFQATGKVLDFLYNSSITKSRSRRLERKNSLNK